MSILYHNQLILLLLKNLLHWYNCLKIIKNGTRYIQLPYGVVNDRS